MKKILKAVACAALAALALVVVLPTDPIRIGWILCASDPADEKNFYDSDTVILVKVTGPPKASILKGGIYTPVQVIASFKGRAQANTEIVFDDGLLSLLGFHLGDVPVPGQHYYYITAQTGLFDRIYLEPCNSIGIGKQSKPTIKKIEEKSGIDLSPYIQF